MDDCKSRRGGDVAVPSSNPETLKMPTSMGAEALLSPTLLDAIPDAMVVINQHGIVVQINSQTEDLFGYTRDELIGQKIEILVPERHRPSHYNHRERFAEQPRTRRMGAGLELYGRRRDGSEFPVEISLSPVEDGDQVLVAAAIRDATDRKRVEGELVAARASAEQAREAADRASQAKSRFLATASHDLRQPLQTLALLNGTLRRTVTDEDAADALAQQEEAIGTMTRLVNALLDISKLESGAVKPEPADFAVADVFDELRREFASTAAAKGLRIEVEAHPVCAYSDPSLIEQVLRNLVANAIKYTRQGRVRMSCLALPDSTVRIEVLDTGIGIPADQLACIYDEFYQIGMEANSSRTGYGLGLSIVKRIVELLDLKLEVRSQVGEGSSFSFLLPSARGELVRPHRERRGPATLKAWPEGRKTPHVLLVEDDPGVRSATRMLLKVEGYRVSAVGSLAEALEAAHAGVDLLVTDYHLRDRETGAQVIAALRKALGLPLKAVLITGDTSPAIRELPRDSNLRIASKPLQAEELLMLLRTLTASEGPLHS
jgi:two-component system, sensor histidine kinase